MTGSPNTQLQWRIYYYDTFIKKVFTYDNLQGSLYDAPGNGCQCILMHDKNNGRYIQAQGDRYWWTGERWWRGDVHGCERYLASPGPKKVIFGESIPDEMYQEVIKVALHDPDFPPKTGNYPEERY